jgi:hypothetical protein
MIFSPQRAQRAQRQFEFFGFLTINNTFHFSKCCVFSKTIYASNYNTNCAKIAQ